MEKIIFFSNNSGEPTGGDKVLLNLAYALSKNPLFEVYYLNSNLDCCNENPEFPNINICQVDQIDYKLFEHGTFILPLEYLFPFLIYTEKLVSVRIILYNSHTYAVNRLCNQILPKNLDKTSLGSLIWPNMSSCLSLDQITIDNTSKYLNTKICPEILPFSQSQTINSLRLNRFPKEQLDVGWVGYVKPNTVKTVENLLDNLIEAYSGQINFHIVGLGQSAWDIDYTKYANHVKLIWAGYVDENTCIEYIKENLDIAFSYGSFAVSVSTCGIPIFITPLISESSFKKYVLLSDIKGHCYSLTSQQTQNYSKKSYTLEKIIEKISAGDNTLAEQCYNYGKNELSLNHSIGILLECKKKTHLFLENIRKYSFVKKQMVAYEGYRTKCGGKYEDYIDYVVRLKNNNNGSTKLIQTLQHITRYVEQKHTKKIESSTPLLPIKKPSLHNELNSKYHYFMKIQKMYKNKIKKLKKYAKTNTIRVAFIVVFSSVFPSRPIFEKMLKDSSFEPYVIVVPDISRSHRYLIETFNKTYSDMLKKYPQKYIIQGYDDTKKTYYDLSDAYQIIFFSNPYSNLVHPFHHITHFLNKPVLPIYISYGFAALKFWEEVISTEFYNYLWKACIETNMNLQHLKKIEVIKGYNGVVTGYVKIDALANYVPKKNDRPVVLICPHHTVWGWKTLNISNFLRYSEFFVELPKLFPEVEFIFRPHPLLIPNLIKYNIWSEIDIRNYMDRLLSSPNICYDNTSDYFESFANSDAMIHDCGSFIAEYLYTMKPCCYMMKNYEETMNNLVPLGKQCMMQHYHAYSKEDIIDFINEVVCNKKDSLREQREKFVKTELMVNYPHAHEAVIQIIKKTLNLRD